MPRMGLTRDKIFETAGKLADEQGFDSVSPAALARLFGVRLPSLYAHITSSDDLKQGVALLGLRLLAETSEEAVAGRSGKDALIALAGAYRAFAQHHPGLFQAARYPLGDDSVAASGGARLAKINHAMLRGYDLEEEDRVHATRLIGAFVLGFSLLELAGSFDHSAPDIGTSWERGIAGLDTLIRSWAKDEHLHAKAK